MEFLPGKITKEHVLKAAEHVKKKRIELIPSTKYSVLIDGDHFPPKDILRYAHEQVNGEHLWKYSGGEPTNRYLRDMGFEITEKENKNDPVSGMVQKYKEIIKGDGLGDEIFKWQVTKEFHQKPDTSVADFQMEMNSIDFSNLVYPICKSVIKVLAKERPEEFRNAFKDLFDESKDLLKRVNVFSEKTLEIYRSIEYAKHSHHQDERTISIYLAYFDANKYPIFKDSFYRKYCKMIGIQHKPKGEKYVHYKALLDEFIDEYIIPDEELLELKAKLIPEDAFEDNSHYILAQDILYQMLDKMVDKTRRYWRVGTSDGEKQYWEIMYEQNHISIGWSELGDLNELQIGSKKDVLKLFEDYSFEATKSLRSRKAGELFNFFSEIKPGDVVIAQDGMKIKGIGIITDDYIFQEEFYFPHTKPVYWQKVADEIGFKNKEGLNTTVFELKDPALISKIDEILKSKPLKSSGIMHSLNSILYGPPGTGKTYYTINLALQIVDPAFYEEHIEDREKLRSRFNELLISDWESPQKGRISFCTFHQSFSYEDFVEGIKPVISKEEDDKEEEEGRIRYEIHDGLFKRMADRARYFSSGAAERDKQTISLTEKQFDAAQFFKLSLGDIGIPEDQVIYEHCVENNCISIGFMRDNNMEGVPVKEIYRMAEEKGLGSYHAQAMNHFKDYLKKGDYVLISKGKQKVRAIGRVAGDYFYDEESPIRHRHFRPVEWIVKDAEIPVEEVYEKKLSQQTIYSLNKKWIKKEFFIPERENKTDKLKDENFVLIIDEISRGNVSQIFGELITLIEKDKRAGMEEALKVTLPYSKQKFSVPSNLYIIGTMNTADRSVEALDTALRRRFSFLEMMPDADLVSSHGKTGNDDGMVEDINLVELLETINERLSYLLDEDHQIGHSFFMNVSDTDDLKMVFRDNIVPLLKEFFYNDFGKVRLVLGDKFVKKIDAGEAKPEFAADEDDDYILDKTVYRVIEIDDGFDIIDALKGVT